jgi:hypothetical protein
MIKILNRGGIENETAEFAAAYLAGKMMGARMENDDDNF